MGNEPSDLMCAVAADWWAAQIEARAARDFFGRAEDKVRSRKSPVSKRQLTKFKKSLIATLRAWDFEAMGPLRVATESGPDPLLSKSLRDAGIDDKYAPPLTVMTVHSNSIIAGKGAGRTCIYRKPPKLPKPPRPRLPTLEEVRAREAAQRGADREAIWGDPGPPQKQNRY